jgi:hypothetical protein
VAGEHVSVFDAGTPVAATEHRRPGSGGARPPGHGLKGVLKDRKVQLGVAAAALLGLVVFLRRGGTGAAADGEGSTPQSITPAVMDSSGTDVYNAIQSLGQGWENDLRDYSSTLTNVSTQLATNTSGLSTLTTAVGKLGPTKAPAGTVKPPVKTPAKTPAKTYATVTKWGTGSWSSTISGIAKHYKISIGTVKKLNPKITNVNVVHVGQKVRVK